MKSLKLLVIVMGVMLVAGVAALAVAIAYRAGHGAKPAPMPACDAASSSLGCGPVAADLARHVLDLPPGAKLLAAQSDGERVMLRLGLADGGEELELIDWKTGARLATIELRAGAAKP